jgi:hypothetical protein
MDGKHYLFFVEVRYRQFMGRTCKIYDHLVVRDLKQDQIKTLIYGVRPILFLSFRIICVITIGPGALIAIAV